MMKRIGIAALMIVLCAAGSTFARGETERDETAQNLLLSTELLLMSQTNLSILSLGLIAGNIEHNYTSVEQDRDALGIVADSLELSMNTTDALMKSNVIMEADQEFIRLLIRANESAVAASEELIGFCDDASESHLKDFSDDMDNVTIIMQKIDQFLNGDEA